MGTLCLESRVLVNFARIWVMVVAKNMCHVVKKRAITRSMEVLRRAGWVAVGFGGSRRSYGSLFKGRALARAFSTTWRRRQGRRNVSKRDVVFRVGLAHTELGA